MFSSWIYKPSYKFKLLFRGSRDGFMPETFHKICDHKWPTVVVIKLKDCGEILGGYNPIGWRPDSSVTYDSFIFSFRNKDEINNHILSRVTEKRHAITYECYCGPSFGKGDLILREFSFSKSNIFCSCSKASYENSIRNTEDASLVEEYEVFQIINYK